MQPDTLPAPDWYDDPEAPGMLRYWDGAAWTDQRAPRGKPPKLPKAAKPAKAPKAPKEPKPVDEDAPGPSFTLVVAGVLGAAAALIVGLTLAVIWVDSYNTGHDRGERVAQLNLKDAQAGKHCEDLAKDVTKVGSALGSWDMPWIIGCKRAAS